MNAEKLQKLQEQVRMGGKGTPRRKKKVVHSNVASDQKLQGTMKKLMMATIPDVEQVNMLKDDGTVLHFNNPQVQFNGRNNTCCITGAALKKDVLELLPGIFNQLGYKNLGELKKEEEEIPELVANFDEACTKEVSAAINDKKVDFAPRPEVVAN